MLIRAVLFAIFLMIPALSLGSTGESMKQYHAETSTPLAEIVRHLEARLPDAAPMAASGTKATVSYSGSHVPDALRSFLVTAFPDVDAELLAPGRTVTLAVTLRAADAGTEGALLILTRLTADETGLPAGAVVLLDGRGAAPCAGQVVVSHDLPRGETAELYQTYFESEGYRFDGHSLAGVSFFVGYRPGCSVTLYFEADGGATVVVAQFSEV
ncbi:hypothetical protein GQ651_17960 [Alphaproteobacteria bacterium GH1-50]|uniref:Uncharacterized protein n=1 Tax=Kangsaoukella pontilimi TaxID=2691042 RepID=A0A7C9MM17_9RHOB|nr:hypothetical protein [Kangsaoukella pontilimi]MXQ09735.1 hypothetical protein [Kangsaoukella pontilimi]